MREKFCTKCRKRTPTFSKWTIRAAAQKNSILSVNAIIRIAKVEAMCVLKGVAKIQVIVLLAAVELEF